MRLRLVAPTKRKDSSNLQFEQRIPADLKERLVGMTLELPRGDDIVPITITDKTRAIRYSLKAADAGEAKRRQAEAVAYLEGVYQSLRSNAPIALTPRQQMGLAAKRAKAFLAAHADDPFSAPLPSPLPMPPAGGEAAWGAMVGRLDAAKRQALARDLRAFIGERDDEPRSRLAFSLISHYPDLKALIAPDMAAGLEAIYGADTDAALFAEGLRVEAATRRMITFEMARFKGIAERGLEAMQSGDYRPLIELDSAPVFVPAPQTTPAVSLRGLFKSWWVEAEATGLSVSTKGSYETAMEALVAFLGHDDAKAVSEGDVVRFKAHLVSTINPRTKKPLSAKTIKDSYLAGLKSVLAWAVDNRKLASNPAAGITMKAARGSPSPRRSRANW